MIRHIFLAAVKNDVSEEKIGEIIQSLKELKKICPTLQAGKNLGWFDKKIQITVTGEFSNREEWTAFVNSPEHTKIVKNYMDCYNVDMIFSSQIEIEK